MCKTAGPSWEDEPAVVTEQVLRGQRDLEDRK
jgi:hypothetical protein